VGKKDGFNLRREERNEQKTRRNSSELRKRYRCLHLVLVVLVLKVVHPFAQNVRGFRVSPNVRSQAFDLFTVIVFEDILLSEKNLPNQHQEKHNTTGKNRVLLIDTYFQ
jgi:hypothetical protein